MHATTNTVAPFPALWDANANWNVKTWRPISVQPSRKNLTSALLKSKILLFYFFFNFFFCSTNSSFFHAIFEKNRLIFSSFFCPSCPLAFVFYFFFLVYSFTFILNYFIYIFLKSFKPLVRNSQCLLVTSTK